MCKYLRMAIVTLLLLAALAGHAPAQDAHLLIADFDSDTIEVRSGLALWVYADEQFGGTSQARPTLIHAGANSSRGALRISFRVSEDVRNPFAGVWAMIAPEGLATDLSAYRGLRFYARSKHESAFTAGIVRFAGQVKRYMTPVNARPEWTLVELPFDTFREVTPAGGPAAQPAPLVASDLTSIGFSVAPALRGDFVLDIDRIEFYR
jgi:hypothetical protein